MRQSRSSQGTHVETVTREGERERAGSQARYPGKRFPGSTQDRAAEAGTSLRPNPAHM